MTGADRFQFFLDTDGRKNTGIGNIIKTHITVSYTHLTLPTSDLV